MNIAKMLSDYRQDKDNKKPMGSVLPQKDDEELDKTAPELEAKMDPNEEAEIENGEESEDKPGLFGNKKEEDPLGLHIMIMMGKRDKGVR